MQRKMEKYKLDKFLNISGVVILVMALFIVQTSAGKIGHSVADLFSYQQYDSYDIYAWFSVHHIVQMIIVLAIIAVLSKLLKIDFGLKPGDRKKGTKFLLVFTGAFAAVAIAMHILMYFSNQLPAYDFPLNINNIIGTLGFQLFLSGPSEEILFRALPITVLVHVFGKSSYVKWHITLEIVIASILFSIAHIPWSLSPFTIDVDYFQLFYAFVLGTIQGIAYQRSRSIIYPMLMHSFSNVLMVGIGYLFAIF